jgi:hypothetical protein
MPERQVSLFTIIMEYRGGTYIAQVAAANPESALKQWARQITPIDIAYFGEARKAELISSIDEWLADSQHAVAITGTRNVWCHSLLIGGFLLSINIVATKKSVVPSRQGRVGS